MWPGLYKYLALCTIIRQHRRQKCEAGSKRHSFIHTISIHNNEELFNYFVWSIASLNKASTHHWVNASCLLGTDDISMGRSIDVIYRRCLLYVVWLATVSFVPADQLWYLHRGVGLYSGDGKAIKITHLNPHDALKHHFTYLETDFILLKLRGFGRKISMKLSPIQGDFIILFSSTSSHFNPLQVENCDSNSRLVVDEDDNGKFRLERVN